MEIKNMPFFCSWSGGKDSCLSLYHAIRKGGKPKKLITMLTINGKKTRSHGLPIEVIMEQSKALGIPLETCSTSWGEYEKNFIHLIKGMKHEGIDFGVFGDIDIEKHREWVERVCQLVETEPYLPLWKKKRSSLVKEFIAAGFKAKIVAVKDDVLDRSFLGRELDLILIEEFRKIGIDVSGENGEYHTVVTNGPIFSKEIELVAGEKVFHNGYWFLDTFLKK